MDSTLVLDVGYQPISFTSWQTAIVWVLEKAVEVVEQLPERYIHTVNWKVGMPSVVRFLKPIHRRRAVKFSRHNIYARDLGRCQYCGKRVSLSAYTYDHVVPRSQGGKTEWANVTVACVPCNQKKGGRTPAQARMTLLNRPVRPKKLPDMPHVGLVWRTGMPESWRDHLRSAVYWEAEMESDES